MTPSSRPPTTTSPRITGCAPGSAPTRSCTSASPARSSGCPARARGSGPAAGPNAGRPQREALLDEYARCEPLDPPKLPALAGRIWTLLHEAELHHDLDLHETEQPALEDFGALIEHGAGSRCETKGLQVRDGRHAVGRPREGEQFDGLLAAILRLGARE